MIWLRRILWVLSALMIALGIAPLGALAYVSYVAERYGCTVNEGGTHPCIVNGLDRGELLYQLGMSGWFLIVSLPLAALGLLLAFVLLVWTLIARHRRPKG